MPDEMVEKAQTLDDAIDNALIAWGMGWDMDGVMACLKEAKDAAALAAAEAETQPVAWQFATGQTVEKFTGEAIWHGVIVARYLTTKGKQRYVVEVQPQGFQMIAVPEQLRASPPIRDDREKALDLIAKMAGNVVFNGKQRPISHEDHMRAWADIEATAMSRVDNPPAGK